MTDQRNRGRGIVWLLMSAPAAGCSAAPPEGASASATAEALGAPRSIAALLRAPAGDLPATRQTTIDGMNAAILANGRLLTPAGREIGVDAPKPFGLAVLPDGSGFATINSGLSPFSITLVKNAIAASPDVQLIKVNATFLGIAFSPDGTRFFASGGRTATSGSVIRRRARSLARSI